MENQVQPTKHPKWKKTFKRCKKHVKGLKTHQTHLRDPKTRKDTRKHVEMGGRNSGREGGEVEGREKLNSRARGGN